MPRIGYWLTGLSVCLLFTGMPISGYPRVNSLSGGVSVSQEHESNIFRTSSDREERWTTLVHPELTFLSDGIKDSLQLTADSDLEWDQRLDERDFSHGLNFEGSRNITPHFLVTIGNEYIYEDQAPRRDLDPGLSILERFIRADDYEREEVARLLFPEIDYSNEEYYVYVLSRINDRYSEASPAIRERVDAFLTNTEERRRNWSNNLFLDAAYEFTQNARLEAGYSYYMRDERTVGFEELVEHSPHLSFSWRLSRQWFTSLSWEMLVSDYDDSEDRKRNNVDFLLEDRLSRFNTLRLNLGFETVDYDEEREGYDEGALKLGWDHHFNPNLQLNSSIEGVYRDSDLFNDERGITLDLSLNRILRRGTFYLDGNVEFDERDEEDGWEKYGRSGGFAAGIDYDLLENLKGDFSFSYSKKYIWPSFGEKEVYDEYGLDTGLSWTFKRWYVFSIQYGYNRLDLEYSTFGDYFEHQVILGLAVNKEFWRW